jgi:putative transposase
MQGAVLAPTLREIAEPDGSRYVVLDLIIDVPVPELPASAQIQRALGWDWGVRTLVTATVLDLAGNRLSPPLFLDTGGFDGRQARTRRHIDRLKSKVAKLEARRDQFPVGDQRREPSERKLVLVRREVARCWRKYEARNTSQIRGALWRCLRYTCHLAGQHPRGTTHTCPHCGKPTNTYASPALDAKMLEAGPWLRCVVCGWNAARDYAAAINIALLGVAFLKHSLHSRPSPPDDRPTMTQKGLNSESYSGSGPALRLPPTSPRGRLTCSGKLFVNGWVKSVTLHSALPPDHMLRLCG